MSAPARLARRTGGRAVRSLQRRRGEVLARRVARAGTEPLDSALRVTGSAATALAARLRTLLAALGEPCDSDDLSTLGHRLEIALSDAGAAEVWLALAVLSARLPVDVEVVEALRRLRLDGPGPALAPTVVRATSWLSGQRYRPRRVEVLVAAVTLDVHHTSRTDLATGIQRVARETARRWDRDHDVVLVGWTDDDTALRRLDGPARRRALGTHSRADLAELDSPARDEVVVVPWRGTHATLELATERARTERMLALARHSPNRTGVIGFDCVPLTTAETTADGMGGAFAACLAAVRHMDRVAAISEAAAVEYLGWRDMLAGTGLPGPDVGAVRLPVAAEEPGDAALQAARSRFLVGSLPMVLVVGSHEPRKNHLAVLHAAETLWREGLAFSLLFVGGNSWGSRRFTDGMHSLRDRGRPVESVSALDDELLWAAYRLAHVVLFPSLNEGFGLPVAEALASGTPVITSRHGSMAEIARSGGALLVDPRDDADLTAALRRVVADPACRAELARQAAAVPLRSWDDYAADLWTALVDDGKPG